MIIRWLIPLELPFPSFPSEVARAILLYAPRLLFALVIILVGWFVSRLVGRAVRSLVEGLGWETVFRKASVGRAILKSGYTPSSFFSTLSKWVLYLVTVLVATESLSIPALSSYVQSFLGYLPRFVGGILILIVGFIFADWATDLFRKGSAFASVETPGPIADLLKLFLYFIVLTIALAQMRVDVTILYIFGQALAWGTAIALGIAFGWYLKDKIAPWLDELAAKRKVAGA